MIRRASALSVLVLAALSLPQTVVAGAASNASLTAPVTTSDITVTGTDVTTYPAFDPAISRYGIRTTGDTAGTVTVAVTPESPDAAVLVNGAPATGTTQVSGLEAGDEVSVIVQDGAVSSAYAFIYLPTGFPAVSATVTEPGISQGLVGLTLSDFGGGGPRFETVLDNHAVPAHVFRPPDNTQDLKVQPNGNYSVSRTTTSAGRLGEALVELDGTFTEVDRHETVGLVDTDGHDSILLADGTKILMSYENDSVTGLVDAVIQEIDSEGNVVLEWNSGQAGLADETVTPGNRDYAHINSFFVMDDGDLLISLRHTSSVLKIARSAHDGFLPGDIVWRLGGRNSDFTFLNDPEAGGPCAQHTASELANGNILIYDNGSGFISPKMCIDPADPGGPPISRPATRITEYDLGDVDADPSTPETAELVWSYDTGFAGFFAGGAVRRDNGNTLIGIAAVSARVAREIDPNGQVVWELQAPTQPGVPGYATYRAAPFPAADDLDVIRPEVVVSPSTTQTTLDVGDAVTFELTCTDVGGSTLQSCDGTPAALDTSTPGTKTYVATAVDGAGNTTTVRRDFEVVADPPPPAPTPIPTPTPTPVDPPAPVVLPEPPATITDVAVDLTLKVPGGKKASRVKRTVPNGAGTVKTIVKLKNRGDAVDTFTLEAKPRKKGFVTKFFLAGKNVTSAVRRGRFTTSEVKPGGAAKIIIRTKRLRRVEDGDRWLQAITATSTQDGFISDRAEHVLKARP